MGDRAVNKFTNDAREQIDKFRDRMTTTLRQSYDNKNRYKWTQYNSGAYDRIL